MDTVGSEVRSKIMRSVRSKDTGPERKVRRLLHALGYRFRLHRKDLPGNPDIVLPKWRAVVFVHGCFWHDHGCPRSTKPATNAEYWVEKIRKTKLRDRRAVLELETAGWNVIVVWECGLKDASALATALKESIERRDRKPA
jgi:DNA mismatch endonuclease, patch repair protein